MEGEKEQEKIIGVLSMEYTVSAGNELFQDFLLGRRQYPLVQLIKEEDRGRFLELSKEHADTGFKTVVRILDIKNEYRWYYIYLKKFQAENGQEFYHVNMRDICHMEERIGILEQASGQYERFLCMQNHMYFIYSYMTKKIRVFWLNGNLIHTVMEEDLDQWETQVCRTGKIKPEEARAFQLVCNDIREGTERFIHDILSTIFSSEGEEKLYRFRGITWKQKDKLVECYGTIQLLDKKTKRIKVDGSLDEQLDPLTGLYNKRSCMKRLKSVLEENTDASITICMLDLDNFKTLNDTYGHLFGDRVLTVVADTMREILGSRGIAGRFGGDEFFMIIDSDIDEQEVRQILFTLRKNIRWYFEKSEDQLVVTMSVGAAAYPKDATSLEELFAKADRALYIAKEKGKDRFIIYDEAKHGRVTFDSEHQKIVELSIQKRAETDKTSTVLYIYNLLEQKGINGLEEIMGFMGKVFAIDRINIFKGPDLQLWKTWGYETWHQDSAAYILKEDFLSNFNENKVGVCNGIEIKAYKFPKTYEYMDKLEIKSYIQYLIGKGAGLTGLISYEICKIKRKWSEDDIHNLTLISRFIENTILKQEE